MQGWGELGTASVPALREGFLPPQGPGLRRLGLTTGDPPAAFCPALSPEPSPVIILMWNGKEKAREPCESVGLVLTSGLWEMTKIKANWPSQPHSTLGARMVL